MNKTLIVLGVGIWCVMLILRFVIPTSAEINTDTTTLMLNLIEIVAFVITVVGVVKRD